MKKYNQILTIFILYIICCMAFSPKLYIDQTFAGITAWAVNVLPSVLPFIFFTKVLLNYGKLDKFDRIAGIPFKKLYNTPEVSSTVFLFSILSGYPVGAKMTADLYLSGKITRSEAFKMTSFCSNSGPMFIIGAVGTMFLGDSRLGYIIFISHVLGSLLNGLLYRKIHVENLPSLSEKTETKQDLSSMVTDSALSIISVGAIIAIFFVVITSLNPIISLLPSSLQGFFQGLIEITRGCQYIGLSLSRPLAVIACTFVISFGGLSTIIQSLTMLDKIKMPASLFCLQKLTHALLATIISVLLASLIVV